MKTLKQKMKGIGPARRKKVEARTVTLIGDEMRSPNHGEELTK